MFSRRSAIRPYLFGACLLVGCAANRPKQVDTARFATFNVSCYRGSDGELIRDLEGGKSPAARAHAEILQRVRPDVVLLNEFDFDVGEQAIEIFQRQYLEVAQGDGSPIRFPYRFVGPVNTGVPTGLDLDRDGATDGPADAFGFGRHPGVYGMVVLSRHPIVAEQVRTFREFLWRDMPDNRMPVEWYDEPARDVLRLSSKSHQDVPIELPSGRVVHFLVSHPTPPVFDGPEDRNGRRNHDEIRLWADYIDQDRMKNGYLRDDAGRMGGLDDGAAFVIAGDLNSDPIDGDAPASIRQLLEHSRIAKCAAPRSAGAVESARKNGGANAEQRGEPATDTGEFGRIGNMRLDYVLPSESLEVLDCGVFWPAESDPASALVTHTDHRLVWVDVRTNAL